MRVYKCIFIYGCTHVDGPHPAHEAFKRLLPFDVPADGTGDKPLAAVDWLV